jgi:glutamate-1-semialdehyde 2,1-aminomutase
MTFRMTPMKKSAEHQAVLRRAKELVPGGTTSSISMPEGLEFIASHGMGPHLFDLDGNRYLDFLTGGGPLILGHAHPAIVDALAQQLPYGTHHFAMRKRTVDLAERLTEIFPSAEMVRFAASGSDAAFNAIRLSRAVTRRRGVIKFDGSWHGHNDYGASSLETSPTQLPDPYPVSAGIAPDVLEDTRVLRFNDIEMFRETIRANPDNFACVIVEPLHRVIKPVAGFLEALREECDKTGTILVFDEVVCGLRIAPGGGQEKYGVDPDLTCLGKAIAGGLPLSALLGKRDIMEHLTPGSDPERFNFHCGTLNGYALAIEAAHAVLNVLVDQRGIETLIGRGNYMHEKLQKTLTDAGETAVVSGEGPMFHFYFTEGPVLSHDDVRASDLAFSDMVHRFMFANGIYKTFNKGYVCLAHEEDHIDEFCALLDWSLRQVRGGNTI